MIDAPETRPDPRVAERAESTSGAQACVRWAWKESGFFSKSTLHHPARLESRSTWTRVAHRVRSCTRAVRCASVARRTCAGRALARPA